MQNYDLKNIYDWPITTRSLVIGLICVIVFYFGYLWDLSSIRNQLTKAQQQEKNLKEQLQLVTNKSASIKANIASLSTLQTTLNTWQKKLIDYRQLPEILNDILKTGANNQLQFMLFNPGEKTQENIYFKVPIKIVAMGDYHQLANFISQIANMPSIVSISSFTISRDSKDIPPGAKAPNQSSSSNAIMMSLTLLIYYLPEKTPHAN